MAVFFVLTNFFSKKKDINIDSAACTGKSGKNMKYVNLPWPPVVAAHDSSHGHCLVVGKLFLSIQLCPSALPVPSNCVEDYFR